MGRIGKHDRNECCCSSPWQTENQPSIPFEHFHFVFVVPIDYRNKSHKVKFFVKSEN